MTGRRANSWKVGSPSDVAVAPTVGDPLVLQSLAGWAPIQEHCGSQLWPLPGVGRTATHGQRDGVRVSLTP